MSGREGYIETFFWVRCGTLAKTAQPRQFSFSKYPPTLQIAEHYYITAISRA